MPVYVSGEQWGPNKIGANYAWDISNGTGAVVAVIDSGVNYSYIPACGLADQHHIELDTSLIDSSARVITGTNWTVEEGDAHAGLPGG